MPNCSEVGEDLFIVFFEIWPLVTCHLSIFLEKPGLTGPQTGQPGGEAGQTGPVTGHHLLVLELLRLAVGWRPVGDRSTGPCAGPAGQ